MKDAILAHTPVDRVREDYPDAWALITESVKGGETVAAWAARQGDANVALFRLNQAAGTLATFLPHLPVEERVRLTRIFRPQSDTPSEIMNRFWQEIDPALRTTLEVGPLLANGEDPFERIQAALRQLPPQGALRLLVPFEPLPLYVALARQGFDHMSRFNGQGWEVLFFHARKENMPHRGQEREISLDVRGLAPPEPLLRVLEATVRLAPGGVLTVTHDRIPTLLYARLEERGLSVTTMEEEGVVRLVIGRPG